MVYNMSCCNKKQNQSTIETVTIEHSPEEELNFLIHKERNAAERLAICKSCPELKALNRCGKCGCFMDIKVRLYKSRCPIGLW